MTRYTYVFRNCLRGIVGFLVGLPLGIFGQAPDVKFSHMPGFYDEPIVLEIQADGSAIIHFTRDGSVPTATDPVYQSGLLLDDRTGDENVVSIIPTNNIGLSNPYREGWRPPMGEVQKCHIIRAVAITPSGEAGTVASATFCVDPNGAQRYTLPVVSLVAEQDSLFGFERGIYVPGVTGGNYFQRGDDWEREVHVSFFEADGSLGFQQDAGVRIHGGTTRSRPRKTLRLYAKSEYGNSWFDYPVFPDKPISRYKRLLLRNSGNDWSESLFRDAYMQALVKENTKLDIQYSRPVIVFINGEYWGIHNVRDRLDDRYLQSHYQLDEERVCILEGNAELDTGEPACRTSYVEMISFIESRDMADPDNFAQASLMMDMDNYIDYLTLQIYTRNTDWPGNNIAYWRHLDGTPTADDLHPGDGRWRWMVFDLDFGFGLDFDYVRISGEAFGGNNAFHNTLAQSLQSDGPGWPNPPWSTSLFRNLIENESFKQRFISRFADHLNTSYKSERALALLDSLIGIYAPEISEHIDRWIEPSMTRWQNELTTLETFADLRERFQRNHLNAYFNLGGSNDLQVDVHSAGTGTVQVNSILLQSATAGVQTPVYPWTGSYFVNIPVRLVAIPAAGFSFSHWDGDVTSTSDTLMISMEEAPSVTAHFLEEEVFTGDRMNPPAHKLSTGPYEFKDWSSTHPEGVFPEHMIFQQSDGSDPTLTTEMTDPYFIPFISADNNDYHADDQDKFGFPYALTGRTRIEGLGDDGIAFINTGRGRDLGTAVLALDTRDVEQVEIDWTGETLFANSRVYHIRLQYRTGLLDTWRDVLDREGELVEYRRSESAGDYRFDSIPLPSDAYGLPYVQLRWKYYFTGIRLSEDSGQRDKLRLDDILVRQSGGTSTGVILDKPTFTLHPNRPNPFSGATEITFTLSESSPVRLTCTHISGAHRHTLLDGHLSTGEYRIPWDGRGRPSGLYMLELHTDKGSEFVKMMMLD